MRRLTLVALLLFVGMFAASCQRGSRETAGPTPTPSPDLRHEKFELTGTVTQVELSSTSDSPISPTPSPSPGATAVPGPGESPVHLSVEIDTINDPARDLCGVGPGDTVILVISPATNIDPQKALSELDDLDSQKISAGGTATLELDGDEDFEGREGGTTRTANPDGGRAGSTGTPAPATATVNIGAECFFDTESLRVVQGEPRGDTSPSPGRTPATPSPTPR